MEIKKTHPQIILSVAGKFHAFHLAKEYAKRDLLQGLYCMSRQLFAPDGIPEKLFHNKFDLVLWQTLAPRVPFAKFSYYQKNRKFDSWMVKMIQKEKPGILHGWNGCSIETFKIASKLGWKTFVERSCPHNRVQYELLREEADNLGLIHKEDTEKLNRSIEELYLADVIVSPSLYSARSYKDPELINKLKIVPLGGNNEFRLRKKNDQKSLKILSVGNTFLRKGTHYLIEAMKYIDDPNAELIIRGVVPDAYRRSIKDTRIKILDAVSYDTLKALYSTADVYVQASIDEGFGMTVLEALSFGIPVVVTTNVGAGELLNDKVAVQVPIRNPEAIAAAILKAIELPSNDFDVERKYILEKNSWAHCASRMINEVYDIAINNI